MARGRTVWRFAGAVALAVVVVAAGMMVGRHFGAHKPAPPIASSLAADFAEFETKLHAVAGIALSPVGQGQASSAIDQQTALAITVDAAQSYCPQFVHQISNGTTVVGPDH
jgi:hypothetical protein